MSKFLSRKFILAVLSAIGGAAIGLSCLEGTAGAVFSAVAAIVPAVVYIITEGAVDIANIDVAGEAENPFADMCCPTQTQDNLKDSGKGRE